MTNEFFLDWAMMTVSLFNVVLLFWLGLTVLFNAEQRTWAIWLAGGGLLLGGAFFVSHSVILARGLLTQDQDFRFWWRLGLSPAVILPFAWYLLILWYTGFWKEVDSSLRRRHRPWLVVVVLLLLLGGIGFVIVANPFFSDSLLAQFRRSIVDITIYNIPLAVLGYPLYIVFCVTLALDALRHPPSVVRVMGEVARLRARRWLVGTSFSFLLIGLLLGLMIVLIVPNVRRDGGFLELPTALKKDQLLLVAWLDLVMSSMVAGSTLLLGQAVVSYEVFTGKRLPRGGFRRYWRNVVILALGYGIVVGLSQALETQLIYSVLLATILMTFFYALLNWNTYAERERYMAHLRPFVMSQDIYEQLLVPPSAPHDLDVWTPFQALCQDLLGTKAAYLVATGPLAPLVTQPLYYPDSAPKSTLPWLPELIKRFASPQIGSLQLDPPQNDGMLWAVPLWSGRGLIGLLLLGEKGDDGLYTQEEIEIARAIGERLIDTRATAVMAKRLMGLQRQRLQESQLIDQQTRRLLHDEVLPSLHTMMLTLSSGQLTVEECQALIVQMADTHRDISNLLRDMPTAKVPQVKRYGLIGALKEITDKEFKRAFDQISWQTSVDVTELAKTIPLRTAEVLFYAAREAVRNAARYGRGSQDRSLKLTIQAMRWQKGLRLIIEDDGVGLDAPSQNKGGGGQGLALHSTMMAVIGGSLVTESIPGHYTRIILTLPLWEGES